MTEWGAFLPHRDKRDRGLWSVADKLEHINFLELKAVLEGRPTTPVAVTVEGGENRGRGANPDSASVPVVA